MVPVAMEGDSMTVQELIENNRAMGLYLPVVFNCKTPMMIGWAKSYNTVDIMLRRQSLSAVKITLV